MSTGKKYRATPLREKGKFVSSIGSIRLRRATAFQPMTPQKREKGSQWLNSFTSLFQVAVQKRIISERESRNVIIFVQNNLLTNGTIPSIRELMKVFPYLERMSGLFRKHRKLQ